jgi:hypothetical protein
VTVFKKAFEISRGADWARDGTSHNQCLNPVFEGSENVTKKGRLPV